MKRFGLGVLGLVVVLAVMGYALRKTITLRLVERVVERNVASSLLDELPDGLHVALCGAGSPLRRRLAAAGSEALGTVHGGDRRRACLYR
jgi:hypothetical protein